MHYMSKPILNFIVIIFLSIITFTWTFSIFHISVDYGVIIGVIIIRIIASRLILEDYSLSWSKASSKSFLIKSLVYISAFLIYMPYFYTKLPISFFVSELFLYIFFINFLMYTYYFFKNKSGMQKTKSVVIYGAGRAGLKLESEFENSEYKALENEDFIKVFGSQDQEGKIIFFDAFPINEPQIKVDIMNPHYGHYYNEGKAPTDDKNPIPINFLTVEDTTFGFLIASKENLENFMIKDKTLEDWFKDALQNHGIGVKTAVGYGYLS